MRVLRELPYKAGENERMKFSDIVTRYESMSSGVPEKFANRQVIYPKDCNQTFTNDEPFVILNKPKNAQNKDTGRWERVYTKEDHKPLFQDVVYLPVLLEDGNYAVIVTATDEIVKPLKYMIEDVPVLYKGESLEDENRWIWYEASELIDGILFFRDTPKEYKKKNGRTESYNIKVLSSKDD